VRSPKIRAAARDQDCTLRLPGCRNDTATTVLCHSNRSVDGKGGAQKADDDKGAFGCFHCHDLLDGRARWPGLTKEMIEMEFTRAVEETRAILAAKGLL
jgi:hypothetical protein